MVQYRRVKQKKLYEKVAEAIHEKIRSGDLQPGEKLESVEKLAENFQVGRSAIREALQSLRAMELVEIKHGEGTFVRTFQTEQIAFPLSTAILMNRKDVQELLEVRKIIEVGTIAFACKNRTEEQLQQMEKALNEMKQANGNEQLGEQADLAFHLAIAEASQNKLLTHLLDHVSDLMQETMKETRRLWLFSKQTSTEKLYEEHRQIFEAIKMRDEQLAQDKLQEHLDNVEMVLSEYLQKAEQTTK